MFFCWSMVNFFIFLGNFYRRMIFGFYVNVFFLILRKIFDIDCSDKLLRLSSRQLSLSRMFSIVASLFIVLRFIVSVFCCGLSLRMIKNRLLRFCLLRYFYVVLFIVKWLEETTMTVFLNYGDVLILLINVAMFFWL